MLSARGVASALGRVGGGDSPRARDAKGRGEITLPVFVSARGLAPHITHELGVALSQPKLYYHKHGGNPAHGVEASLLPEICDVWLKARDAGDLNNRQQHIALRADILMRELARVGIIALVDEVTGYQQVRDRDALERILEKYISNELGRWAKTFPDEFYQELFRLRGWQYNPFSVQRPSYVGTLTNDIVYDRLAPGVLDELKRITPKDDKGRRRHKYFQRLTEDVGHPKLRDHISGTIALMRAASDWRPFYRLLQRSFPKMGEQLSMNDDE